MSWLDSPDRRSYPVIGEMVKHFRIARGWTQEDLADISGFSVRLIAKAEAGGSLHPDTIEVLADAMSSQNLIVNPEDLIASPRQLSWTFMKNLARYEKELVSHSQHFLFEDMIYTFPGDEEEGAPLSGTHKSIDAFDKFMHNFFRIFERPDKDMILKTSVIAAEGNHAFVGYEEWIVNNQTPTYGRGAGKGLILHFEFSRGKVVHLDNMFNANLFTKAVADWRNQEEKC